MSNNLLKGKRGIITGALNSASIAWQVAEKAHQQGAIFTLTNAPVAMRMGEIKDLVVFFGAEWSLHLLKLAKENRALALSEINKSLKETQL